jgi:coenzyme F420-0:L-glutamate ligase/coenzyme F420-1:gamma-L-glutamate ligase
LQITPVHIEKEIDSSDNISKLISQSAKLNDGDILVIAQKIISKQEGRVVALSTVTPSLLAQGIGSQYHKDPRVVELILSESKRIVRMKNEIIIVQTHTGFICANAGIDESNVKNGYATLLPADSDLSAQKIRDDIKNNFSKDVAVVVSDTFGRPFRMGQTNCAIGISGLNPILDYAGTLDSFGRILRVTEIAIADEFSAAAELVMGKTLNCPVVIIRDYLFEFGNYSVSSLIRSEDHDLFK